MKYSINEDWLIIVLTPRTYGALGWHVDKFFIKNKVKAVNEADKIPSKLSHIPFSNFKLLLLPDYCLVHKTNK